MGFEQADWKRLESQVISGNEWLKPGWCRINLSYVMSPEEVQYIVQAVQDLSCNAWKLLPQYQMDPAAGAYGQCCAVLCAVRAQLCGVQALQQGPC